MGQQPDAQCHCGRPVATTIAPVVEVALDLVGLRMEGVPVRTCAAGHVVLADPDLAARVLAAVDDRVLVARRRRMRADDACGDCDAALLLPGRRTEVPVPFAAPSGVVTPTLLATFTRCPDCGRAQVDAATRRALPGLVAGCLDRLTNPMS